MENKFNLTREQNIFVAKRNIVEYDEKMKDIIDFYKKAVCMMEDIDISLLGFQTKYGFHLIDDAITDKTRELYPNIEEIVKGQKEILLIKLGFVGERIMKYILLLEQIINYPTQTLEEFKSNQIFKIGDKGNNGRDVRRFYNLNQSLIDSIILAREQHSLQPLHDYSYLYSILNVLYPNSINDINKFLELSIKRKIMIDSNLPSDLKEKYSLFPQRVYVGVNDVKPQEMEIYKREFEHIIQVSGDSFTVLRYLENNPNNKQYDVKLVLDKINYLIEYIKLIHEVNNDDITKDIEFAFIKYQCIKEKTLIIIRNFALENKDNNKLNDELQKEKHKINQLFELDRITKSISLIEVCIFYSSLSFDEIKELADEALTDDELYALLYNNIKLNVVKYFRDNGIGNITDMIRIILNKHININNFESTQLTKEQFQLLIWLDIDTIKKLEEHSKVYNYLISKPQVLNKFFRNYYSTPKLLQLFELVIECKEIENNPQIFNILDYNQLEVLKQLNREILTNDEILDNIKCNYQYFSNLNIFYKLPIMLNADNNKKIYELLLSAGLDIGNLDKLDSTIFCIPYEIVDSIFKFMNEKNMQIITDGDVSSKFYSILEFMRKNNNKDININIPLPLRHLRFNEETAEASIINQIPDTEPVYININLTSLKK